MNPFLINLPDNLAIAGKIICDSFISFISFLSEDKKVSSHDEYLKGYALLRTFLKKYRIDMNFFGEPNFSGNLEANIKQIESIFAKAHSFFQERATIASLEQHISISKKIEFKGSYTTFQTGMLREFRSYSPTQRTHYDN